MRAASVSPSPGLTCGNENMASLLVPAHESVSRRPCYSCSSKNAALPLLLALPQQSFDDGAAQNSPWKRESSSCRARHIAAVLQDGEKLMPASWQRWGSLQLLLAPANIVLCSSVFTLAP